MFNIIRKEIEWNGRTLSLETGKIARQADCAIKITYGNTVVLCTVVASKEAKEGVDFLPLTVNYQHKTFAVGKIPGGFFKREGRPTEKEILVSRLIDRPLRPLFAEGFYHETQVICTVLSHDQENDPDVISIIGASAAIVVAGLPFSSTLAASRIGYVNNEYIVNPTISQMENSDLDLVVAGTNSSVLMVESEANNLSEEVMIGAIEKAHNAMQDIIILINDMKNAVNNEEWSFVYEESEELKSKIYNLAHSKFEDAYKDTNKQSRSEKLRDIRDEVKKLLLEENQELDILKIELAIKKLEKTIMRNGVLNNSIRIDGRTSTMIRDIQTEISTLPITHGSALFTRGETQALVVSTLGTLKEAQIVDELSGEYKENFMLHYNFPSFATGEVGGIKSPSRREIGHGKLAWRALRAMLPDVKDFPYSLRVVSEITESNGSSSMATVCGGTLSLMDAGVPLKAPVAGIAMGLIKESDKFVVLSDILGDEDYLGDMDFKVAGTNEGITALQMDIKIAGITTDIMKQAISQARQGIKHILDIMNVTISENRKTVSNNAPKLSKFNIAVKKIGELIGPGGKNIKKICSTYNVEIDIEEDGVVTISSISQDDIDNAKKYIQDLVAEIEVGKIYKGKVIRVLDFGAFVNFIGNNDGLVHISEINDERIEDINTVIFVDQEVYVKVIGFDRGKVRLSMRVVNQETGELYNENVEDSNDNNTKNSSSKSNMKKINTRNSSSSRLKFDAKEKKNIEVTNNVDKEDSSDSEEGVVKKFF